MTMRLFYKVTNYCAQKSPSMEMKRLILLEFNLLQIEFEELRDDLQYLRKCSKISNTKLPAYKV